MIVPEKYVLVSDVDGCIAIFDSYNDLLEMEWDVAVDIAEGTIWIAYFWNEREFNAILYLVDYYKFKSPFDRDFIEWYANHYIIKRGLVYDTGAVPYFANI